MRHKIDPNHMSPQELEDYVKNLPEKSPPKMSSAGWLAVFATLALLIGIGRLNHGISDIATWTLLGGSVLCFVGVGYIVYRISHFNSKS